MNELLRHILEALSDGKFHSGSELGDARSVSRAAISKAVSKLKDYDLEVSSVTGKGYCLDQPLSLLSKDKILKNVKEEYLARCGKWVILDEVDSTNDYLLQLAEKIEVVPTVCLAEMQTRGRGRLGRSWFSPFGKNIYFSLLWPLKKGLAELQGLSLVVALAVVHALEKLGLINLSVKWPNDVLCESKKLSGVLLSVHADVNDMGYVVIGIGINANMQQAETIEQPWTSVLNETARLCDRNDLVSELVNALFEYLDKFESKGFSVFISEWQYLDSLHNKPVTVYQPQAELNGMACGVNENGQLLLKVGDNIEAVSVGDVSVRLDKN